MNNVPRHRATHLREVAQTPRYIASSVAFAEPKSVSQMFQKVPASTQGISRSASTCVGRPRIRVARCAPLARPARTDVSKCFTCVDRPLEDRASVWQKSSKKFQSRNVARSSFTITRWCSPARFVFQHVSRLPQKTTTTPTTTTTTSKQQA